MLTISDELAGVLADGNYTYRCRVDSWRGSELLASDIPVASGTLTIDVTLNVPETLQLRVPRVGDDGTVWAPGGDANAPLACWGQQLQVSIAVETTSGFEVMSLGSYYIVDCEADNTTVTVTASGLLGLIQEAEFISPFQPSGSFGTTIRQIVEPAFTANFTAAPTSRTVPANTVQSSGRLDALDELLDAWGAIAYIDQNGILVVKADGDTTTSSLDLTDGSGGTTMRWGNKLSRDGAANAVVARGNDATGADVTGTAYDLNPASPTYYRGPFNGLPVPFEFSSPLLTTTAQCNIAALTIMARRKRQACMRLYADAVPNFALQPRDGVTVTSVDLGITATFGIVDQIILPLTPSDGPMNLGVRIPL